jgi:hypothetical protein
MDGVEGKTYNVIAGERWSVTVGEIGNFPPPQHGDGGERKKNERKLKTGNLS